MGSTDRKIRDKMRSHKRIYFDYISIVAPSTSSSKHKQVEKLIFFQHVFKYETLTTKHINTNQAEAPNHKQPDGAHALTIAVHPLPIK